MRKAFNVQKESLLEFSALFVAGDTAILSAVSLPDDWLHCVSSLLRRGVLVRTPGQMPLDIELCRNASAVEALTCLAGAMDRKVQMYTLSAIQRTKKSETKKPKEILEAKVHRLIEEQGLGVVEACRTVHCRASDYYIYRSKQKAKKHDR